MKSIRAAYPRPVLIALAAAVTSYTLVWLASQHKLIYTDEVVFAEDFARIARGEWADAVIPHPPLYVALASLSTRIFGYTLPAMRVIGGLAFAATLGLIPWACHALIQDAQQARRATLTGITIYAIHPLALQGSLLLDVDNTIFTPAMLLCVIALALTESSPPVKRIALVGASFAFMLWTKLLPTSLLIAVSALIVYAPRRRLFVVTALGIVFGLILFAMSFGIFAAWVNFPLDALSATFQRTQEPLSGGTQKLIARTIMGGGITLVWLGVPFVLGYGVAVARRILALKRTQPCAALDVIMLCSLMGLALFSAGNELPMGFPRYHYPLFLLMVLLVSRDLAEYPPDSRERSILLVVLIACAAYFALVIPDPLLPQYQLTFETDNLLRRLSVGLRSQATAFVLPFAAAWLVAWVYLRNRARAFQVAAIAFCLASWGALTVTQTRADYATIYEYGRQGAAEASAVVRERTPIADTILAPKEMIFASQRAGEYVLLYVCPACTAQKWIERFETQPPAAYVLTTKEDGRYTHITRDPQVLAVLARCYEDRVTVGSYLIYMRKSLACVP